jgi:DNA-directed RNA polymerase sigma subunit (sigma70/sigma32)
MAGQLETDEQLIDRIKQEQDSEAFEKLQQRHGGLFTQIVKRYSAPLQNISGVCFQDVIESKTDILFDAVRSYDNERGTQFNTWFGDCIGYHCKSILNNYKLKKYEPYNPQEMKTFVDEHLAYIAPENYSEEMKLIFETLNRHPDKRLAQIFYYKYFLPKPDNSFQAIGKRINLSRQGVINLYRKALRYLRGNKNLIDWIRR